MMHKNNVLYTLEEPRQNRCVHGYSKQLDRLIKTCRLASIDHSHPLEDHPTFRCRTYSGSEFIVIVLPSDLEKHARQCYDPLFKTRKEDNNVCKCPDCVMSRMEDHRNQRMASVFKETRKLLIWLALLSLVLGSKNIFGTELWGLFGQVLRIWIEL